MTKITGFRKIGINIGIILFFIFLAYAYLFPLIEGKVLGMPDIMHHKGMSKELVDYRNETGNEAIWTNSMFGGMPGYLISVYYPGNISKLIHSSFYNSFPYAAMIILYLLGFFILLSGLKIKRWLSVAGAIAFGFSSYFLIIIVAGHTTKTAAIGYLAPVIAGVLIAFRGKPLGGALLFSAALSLEILANHLQMTYYGFLMIVVYAIVQLIYSYKEKELIKYFKAVLFLAFGAIIAIGMNFSRLYTTWEYSKETIRGPSELSSNDANKTTGLDRSYVVQWSQGIDETLTLLVPNYMGGSTSTNPTIKGETYRILRENNVNNPREVLNSIVMYRGDKPSTAGPYYFGAIVVFLFILGLFLIKGPIKWWLLLVTVAAVFMAWGKNMMGLTNFLLDYLPMYNKFRAPEMTLIMAAFAFPLLGFWTLNEIHNGKIEFKDFKKGLIWAFSLTGGLSLLFYLAPGITGSFSAPFDANYPDWLLPAIIDDRKELFKMDAIRSFGLITAGAALLYFNQKGKIKNNSFIIIIGLLILIDLWTVDKRYLNNENFVSKREASNPFPEMPVDKAILQDKDISYRVLPIQNPFMDARTSYYHKNVGGYHAAKLRRYNDLIEEQLIPETNRLINSFQKPGLMDSTLASLSAINMLNTRYFIYDLNQRPLGNKYALGNAWFVNNYKLVKNADEEIAALKQFNSINEAIVDQRFESFVKNKNFVLNAENTIELVEYQPNYLKYTAKAATEQLTVFSEVFYDKGWIAYIDGEKTGHFRVNYVLRAMTLPAGEHIVEFKFEPKSYYLGNKISLASSLLLILMIIGYGYMEIRKKKSVKKEN